MTNRAKEFKSKLKALLEEYNGEIQAMADGEGYSMTVNLEITIDGNDTVIETNEWETSISHHNL